MISGAPLTEKECRKIANRVGFIKKTHYGEEFIVRAKENTSNVAYLSTPLQMHTDLPYYEYKPGINLLHCLVQSESPGAFNLLADGFYVSERLKTEYPDAYKVLTETLVNWSDYGEEDGNQFQKIYRAPVVWYFFFFLNYQPSRLNIFFFFSLDYEGNLERINYSVPQRDSFFTIDSELVNEWYEALAKFVRIHHDESVAFKMKPGIVNI